MSDAPPRRPFRYKVAVAAAWLALAWEAAWPLLWPPVAVVMVFTVLALFDVPALLPWWAHWLVLVGFATTVLVFLVRGLRRFSLPEYRRAARRVELVSGWSHRPLTAADDSQLAGTADAGSRRMWRTHKDELGRLRLGVRSGWPHPGQHMRDRFGLRPILILTVFVALVIGGGDRLERLAFAVSPGLGATAATVPVALDLFVTPPDYTRLPPIYRTGADGEADITAPRGSVLMARVSGARSAPELTLAGRDLPFLPLGGDAYEVEVTPDENGTLAVESGGDVLGTWRISLISDAEPAVSFADPVSETARWAMRVAWQATDEYGITAVRLHLALADAAPEALERTDETIVLSQPLRPAAEADGIAFEDLTPHPWAGLPVTAWLEADDGAGQTGRSDRIDLTLPERAFAHPIAQALVDQRRRLLHDPSEAEFVAEVLQDLSIRPNRFGQDIVVFMAMRTAARRLQWSTDPTATVAPVAALLWDTALRLEDGNLSLAFDQLRRAQEALQEALDSDADDAEIAALTEDLRQAMDAYLEAMRQDLEERLAAGELGELQTIDPDRMINQDQLAEMLDRIEELGQTGARDEASELLSQLQQMMENLQPGAQMAQPGEQSQQGMEMLQDLQALTQAQQELLDRTFQQATQTPRGDPQNREFSDEAGQVQDALRRQLGETMRRLGDMMGDIPGELGRAELAMRDAERALGQGEPRRATGPQTEALDQLQQGLQRFAEQVMEQMAQQGQIGVQPGQLLPQRRAGDDPLGRRVEGDGGISGEGGDLPGASAVERARTILDELRRRAGERARPQEELDYIDRLLRRF